jgi:hypothetical protein
MLGSESAGFLASVLLLGAQLPQAHFLPLRDSSLCDESAEDNPAGLIQPMPGERVDHLTPNALLEDIKIRRRLWASPAREHRHNGERG